MQDIQLDMFEVQLGAAILLQFRTGTGLVRVLADAGVKAKGYKPDHVLKKLLPLLDESGNRHIDLMIGTHYDEDHLIGLVPIIEEKTITIGEAWMPPIVNDSEPMALDAPVRPNHLLAYQFSGEAGPARLNAYLAAKRADCELLAGLEGKGDLVPDRVDTFKTLLYSAQAEAPEGLDYFRAQIDEAHEGCGEAGGVDPEPHPEVEAMISDFRRGPAPAHRLFWDESLSSYFAAHLNRKARDGLTAALQIDNLNELRQGAAEDAVNASALHDVVQALSKRGVPIRSEIIDDGEPRLYRWDAGRRRFLLTANATAADDLSFTLLGPSRWLVNKHRERLPVEYAAKIALSFVGKLRGITPSNQLSYIGRFDYKGQGILIAGDAGCVDFKPPRGTYYQKLLDALLPLHIIQIAHHGGLNDHFYWVLWAANYAAQTDPSLLLLSHAAQDKTRPSPEFADFLLSTLKEGDDAKLLFTSTPTPDKVAAYRDAFFPVKGGQANVGDIQVVFGDGAWAVTAHAVAAP
ncbi:hypothetical protein EIK56_27180 [Sphingomonas sp. C8-2]|nr:hypothetical protein EIK56_27180 [Sphingomonas sp. C8-2]